MKLIRPEAWALGVLLVVVSIGGVRAQDVPASDGAQLESQATSTDVDPVADPVEDSAETSTTTDPLPGAVLVDENFDGAVGKMPAYTNADPGVNPSGREYGYVNGEYLIKFNSGGGGPYIPGSYADATVALDARVVDQIDLNIAEVDCRMQPDNSGYRFLVFSSRQLFRIVRQDARASTDLVSLGATPVPSIRFGGGSNHLELKCVGSTLTARINGATVATVSDSTYASGRWALGVSSVSNRPTAAYFDNLQVIQE